MRKNRLFMMAASLCAAWCMTSCSNEAEDMRLPAQSGSRQVTFSVTLPDGGATTRTAYEQTDAGLKVTWAAGDQVSVYNTTEGPRKAATFTLASGKGTSTATFKGEIPDDWTLEEGNDVYIQYPVMKDMEVDGETNLGYIDLRLQKPGLDNLQSMDLITASAKYTNETIKVSEVVHNTAFLYLPKDLALFTDDSSVEGEATLTLSGVNSGQSLVADLHDDIVMTTMLSGGRLAEGVYLAFLPYAGHTPKLTITSGEENVTYILNRDGGFKEGNMYAISSMESIPIEQPEPLTIEALAAGTITISNPLGLEISYKKNDEDMVTSEAVKYKDIIIQVAAGDKVQFFGDNTSYAKNETYGSGVYHTNIICFAASKVYGNIMSLISSTNYKKLKEFASSTERNFQGLFAGNTGLTDASGLILPATYVRYYGYADMFSGCSNLKKAPELPATTVSSYCYSRMFSGCSSLETAPEILPAMRLATYCYEVMFSGCSKLTKAPELPATSLASYCYQYMFSGCGLTTAPKLPAKTMAANCYDNMFSNCGSLTTVSELPATTLAESCYESMFSGCGNLTTAPEQLPATTLAKECYYRMFVDCKNLTTAPELPAAKLAVDCYCNMFYGCSSLNSLTCLVTDTSVSNYTFNWLDGVAATGTFTKAGSMTSWIQDDPSGIPSGWTVATK